MTDTFENLQSLLDWKKFAISASVFAAFNLLACTPQTNTGYITESERENMVGEVAEQLGSISPSYNTLREFYYPVIGI
jgi:hypothetical protein